MPAMLEQNQLIPFEPADIPPGPWLVFAPHPDDETLGMGGSIALACRQGVEVQVVVMTRGELAGDPEQRKQECLQAGRVLGIDQYHFWSIADQGIKEAEIALRDLEAVTQPLQPKTIFLPGIQEFHPDHRAATRIILGLLQSGSYQGSVWLYEISRQGEANHLVDISQVIGQKVRAIQRYQSQLAQVDYQDMVLGLNRARSYTLGQQVTYAEAFWANSSSAELYAELLARFKQYFSRIYAKDSRFER